MTALRKAHNRVLVFVVFTFTCMKGLISQELRRFARPTPEASRLNSQQQVPPSQANVVQVASLKPLSLRGMQISAVSTPSQQSSPLTPVSSKQPSPSVQPICIVDCDVDGDDCDGCDGCASCDSGTCSDSGTSSGPQ